MGCQVVLFHSALGRRPAVLAWADELRAAGHSVETPDLFDGAVFDDLAEGVRRRDAIGISGLIERAAAAVAGLPDDLVFAGFSMGAAAAEFLAATRPGARAAILMHGAIAPAAFGVESWPAVPVQAHYAAADPWMEAGQVEALATAARASGAPVEVHVYPGAAHLFADAGHPDHDAESARLMLERSLGFLDSLPAGG